MLNSGTTASSDFKRQVVLLVNVFPFDRGEEFLEAEIPFLAKEFDRVLILPLSRTTKMRQTRSLPENAHIIEPEAKKSLGPHILLEYAKAHPFQAFGSASRALASGFPSTSRIVEDLKFDLVSNLIADTYVSPLRDALAQSSRTLFYSYWFVSPARVALVLQKRLGLHTAPVVSRAHGYDLYEERSLSARLPQRKFLLSYIQEVYPVSKHGRDYLGSRYPCHSADIVEQHLGVEGTSSAGNPRLTSGLIYSCSSVIPLKRLPLLVESISEAQRAGFKVRWCHIGSGPAEQMEQLLRHAEDLLLPGSYELIGAVSNSSVREIYARNPGTAFINVSETEGVPVSIMEALAQGLPVIATNVGGTGELLDSSTRIFPGLLSSHPTSIEIADRIISLLSSDESEYACFVNAAIEQWRTKWSASVNFAAFASRLARLSIER